MQKPVRACLIIIGNEILSGRTQDKNMSWLAKRLNDSGVQLAEARVIPDIEDTIIDTVNLCRKSFDYVLTTGGIGPTHDDITSAAIAKAFGVKIERNAQAVAILERHYGGKVELNAARLKMTDIPAGASLIMNPVSAAPGFRMENVFVMAGVPDIMQAMFDNIRHELKGGEKMLSRTISAYVTEGVLAAGLTDIQDHFPDVEIGSYPFIRQERLGTSLVSRSTDPKRLDEAHERIKQFLLTLTREVAEEDLAA